MNSPDLMRRQINAQAKTIRSQQKRIEVLEAEAGSADVLISTMDKRITMLEEENAHLKEELEMYSGYKEGGADE